MVSPDKFEMPSKKLTPRTQTRELRKTLTETITKTKEIKEVKMNKEAIRQRKSMLIYGTKDMKLKLFQRQ